MNKPEDDKELVKRLRAALDLPEDLYTDAEVLFISEGTLNRALVEFGLAWSRFWEALRK